VEWFGAVAQRNGRFSDASYGFEQAIFGGTDLVE
jgi:hypothetical protein